MNKILQNSTVMGSIRHFDYKCRSHVFLDFDGVVFANKMASRHVIDRSVEWVSKSTGAPKKAAKELNLLTYKTQGHTSLLNGPDKSALKSYNDFVFDDYFLEEILPECIDKVDVWHTNRLREIASNRDLRYILCTNAPKRYCERVLSIQGMDFSDFFQEDLIFSSDITQSVKPTQDFYDFVNLNTPDYKYIHFIDDSPINIARACFNYKWYPLLIKEKELLYNHLASFPKY